MAPPPPPVDVLGFTTTYTGMSNVLMNRCAVSAAFDPRAGGQPPATVEFDGLWDTGATNSVITQQVISACNLAPTGMTKVFTANGQHDAETYLVNIALPSGVTFSGLKVTKGDLRGADMLIGMDVINEGDFAVSNHAGVTKFTFRLPSHGHIDFVADGRRQLRTQPPQFQHGGSSADRKPRPNKKKKH